MLIGIDVAKAELVLATRPNGERWTVANDERGVRTLVERLRVEAPPKPGYPKAINSLGDHLTARRLDLALTQREIAARLGVDPDSVRNWEAGRTFIEVRYYPELIAFLGYNPLPQPRTPGEAIRRERMSRGMSRNGLADLAGVDEATVRRLEADTPRTALRPKQRILHALGLWPATTSMK